MPKTAKSTQKRDGDSDEMEYEHKNVKFFKSTL